MAGGLGKRMNSDLPKVLHLLNKQPILVYVIRTAISLSQSGENLSKILIIVGKYATIIKETLNRYLTNNELQYIEYVIQEEPKGTGHAVQQILPVLVNYPQDTRVMVLSGDVPLINPKTLLGMLATYDYRIDAEAVIITTHLKDPTGNGRILRDAAGDFVRIVEEKDCINDIERQIKEINAGIYLFRLASLSHYLPLIKNDNAQHEFYLPDVLPLLTESGRIVSYIMDGDDQYQLLNINDQENLKQAQRFLDRMI